MPNKPGRPALGPGKGRRGGRIAYRVDAALLEAAEAEAARAKVPLGEYARLALSRQIALTAPARTLRRLYDAD